jgi:putative heme-binding domain-containing protein
MLRDKFHQMVTNPSDETESLEGLWSLNILGGFDETLAIQLLKSPHPAVRSWTVRLLGDNRKLSTELAHQLDEIAEQEKELSVRQQLACSAARFPADQAMPIINANINRDIDADDPYMPLLWWWAVEKHSVMGREEVLKRFVRPSLWKSRLGRDLLLTRLIRRYAAERSADGLDSVVRLLKAAPNMHARQQLWPHVLLGWQELVRDSQFGAWREMARNHEVSQLLLSDFNAASDDLVLLRLGCGLRHAEPIGAVKRAAFDAHANADRRVAMLEILSTLDDRELLSPSLEILANDPLDSVRAAALRVLAQFDDPAVAKQLFDMHQSLKSVALQSQIRDVLLSRASSARVWLEAVDRGEISAASTTLEQISRVAMLGNPQLDALVTKHWGKLQGVSREEKLAEVRRLNNDLRAGVGNAEAGRQVFKKHCAACHQLFGEGTNVGPDLTTANRQDREFVLVSLVDPNLAIRKEYMSVIVQTQSGRILTGLAIERTEAALTLVDSKSEKLTIATSEIEDMRESPVSLMPENLYQQLKPAELRDLFAYLQLKQ